VLLCGALITIIAGYCDNVVTELYRNRRTKFGRWTIIWLKQNL